MAKKKKEKSAKAELELIREEHGGVLRPKNVVDYARNPKTALHSRFEWDDTEAAEQYRLVQARQLIRCVVVMLPSQNKSTHAYVSLQKDRRVGDSYRHIEDIMVNPIDRHQLVQQALDEARAWRNRHADLVELVQVFEAIDNAGKEEAA